VGEVGTSRVAVRRGNRDGTFGPPTTYPVGLDPWWVTANDLLKNGKVDLLVANGLSGSISVLLWQRRWHVPARRHLLTVPQ
jgi:hypothetical protein